MIRVRIKRASPFSLMSSSTTPRLTLTHWLILIIASIGFLFDTYELLMTPLVAVPAIAELLKLPLNHPAVTGWMGRMLWITALCGGTFGLLGGWLIDRFGLRWQIVPAALDGMMRDKDPTRSKRVTDALLTMVKLDIAALEKAFRS